MVFLSFSVAKKILAEKIGEKFVGKPIEILDSEDFFSLSKTAIKILRALGEQPTYPNDLAKKLRLHEQKVYYHINKLKEAGFIEVVKEEKKKGAVSKWFSPRADAFGIELSEKKEELALDAVSTKKLKDFFYEFIKDGFFNGSIVVGSPTVHGPYLTAARDGHYAVHLAMFLGNFCELSKRFVVKLDTEAKAEKSEKRNMILIGGPVTNIITSDLNKKLKIAFEWKNSWKIVSSKTKKEYVDDDISMIAKIKNPWDETKAIVLLAGLKFEGTKACIIALTQHFGKLLKSYEKKKDFYCLIKGLDKDGDGKVDDIEFLENFCE